MRKIWWPSHSVAGAKARVQSQGIPRGICGGQSGTNQEFCGLFYIGYITLNGKKR
jgi:hypothetical protein